MVMVSYLVHYGTLLQIILQNATVITKWNGSSKFVRTHIINSTKEMKMNNLGKRNNMVDTNIEVEMTGIKLNWNSIELF